MSSFASRIAVLSHGLGPAPVTRFAPSPTGFLHLGHVVNAVFVWGIARAAGGRVRLRIEDHDRVRCTPAFEAALLEDLDWLGFVPDDGRHPVARQCDRDARYRGAVDRLLGEGHVYACACSRREIGGPRYPGTCRDKGLVAGAGLGLRVRLPEGAIAIDDRLSGSREEHTSDEFGDTLLVDRNGQWTYQFAVTVDDMMDGITLVIRGEDLSTSTGRQLVLARLLGRQTPPVFVHHPLVVTDTGQKLSKSAGDTGVRDLRAAGATPAWVIGAAAVAVGLVEPGAELAADAVSDLFRPRGPGADRGRLPVP